MLSFKLLSSALIVAGTGVAASATPLQAEALPVTQAAPSPDACLRTIKTLGASMGYVAMPAEKPTYLFILRVNGVDYNALCDAATGSVKDVTPKGSH